MGDTVRRATGPWTPTVHAFLRHLEAAGFTEAPRVMGTDERGREILSFIDGETVGDDDPWPVWSGSEDTLVGAIEILRRFHDVSAGFEPPEGARWRFPGAPGPAAIVVHGDWAPYNVVWRDGRVVGVIDWDLARPGDPLDDLAFAAWQWAPLHHPAMIERGPVGPWQPDRERRLGLLLDTYGLEERSGFIGRVARRMHASIDGIERGAAGGDEGMVRLRDLGVIDDIQRSIGWVEAHEDSFSSVLRS